VWYWELYLFHCEHYSGTRWTGRSKRSTTRWLARRKSCTCSCTPAGVHETTTPHTPRRRSWNRRAMDPAVTSISSQWLHPRLNTDFIRHTLVMTSLPTATVVRHLHRGLNCGPVLRSIHSPVDPTVDICSSQTLWGSIHCPPFSLCLHLLNFSPYS